MASIEISKPASSTPIERLALGVTSARPSALANGDTSNPQFNVGACYCPNCFEGDGA